MSFRTTRSFRTVCAAAVSVVAAAAGVLSATTGAPHAAAAPGGCPDINVIAVPGTWETSDSDPRQGMLSLVTRGLPGNVQTDYVSYAATALPWEGAVYGRSEHEGVNNARGMIADMAGRCGNTRFALLGYSQGANVAGDVAAEIGTGIGVIPPDRLIAVGLLSDPRRSPTDALVGPPVPGAGAGGARVGGFGWVSPAVRTFCAAGDLYCSVPTDDLAGRFAGWATELSAPDLLQVPNYVYNFNSILGEALIPGWQSIMSAPQDDPSSKQWTRQIQDFLASGVHQSYPHYVVDSNGTTATTWLHNWLSDLASH